MRNGLIRPLPSWQPQPMTPPVRGGVRVPRGLLVFLVVLTAAFLSPLRVVLNAPVGWLAILLACAVLRQLVRHRAEGGWRALFQAAAESVVAGALVFALMSAAAPVQPARRTPPAAKRRPPVEQAQVDPWVGKVAEWWQQVRDNAPVIQFPDRQGGR